MKRSAQPVHRCLACGAEHEVTRARAEMGGGAQLFCSLACEKRHARARWFKSQEARTEALAFLVVLALLGFAAALS
jgi:hypothetical protein